MLTTRLSMLPKRYQTDIDITIYTNLTNFSQSMDLNKKFSQVWEVLNIIPKLIVQVNAFCGKYLPKGGK